MNFKLFAFILAMASLLMIAVFFLTGLSLKSMVIISVLLGIATANIYFKFAKSKI